MSKITSNPNFSCMCPRGPQITEDPIRGEILCLNCGVVLESNTIGHNNPNGVAGVLVYTVSEKKFSQRNIALLAGVSDVSIRNIYKKTQLILNIKTDAKDLSTSNKKHD